MKQKLHTTILSSLILLQNHVFVIMYCPYGLRHVGVNKVSPPFKTRLAQQTPSQVGTQHVEVLSFTCTLLYLTKDTSP